MSNETNGQAFIAAAQQVTEAASTLNPQNVTPEARVARLQATLEALASMYKGVQANMPAPEGDSVVSGAAALDPTSGDPAQVTCSDGTTFTPPPQTIGSLNRVTDTSEQFFPPGALGAIEKFLVNVMADVAAAVAIFGQVGSIQARELINGFNALRPTVTISPDIAADMVERNILPFDLALEEAKAAGVGQDRFNAMVKASGEPPGIMQMIELLRREYINEDELYTAVALSRVYTDYFCDLLNLAHETMSGADAIEGYVKGVPITVADFENDRLTPPADQSPENLRNEYFAAMFRRAGGLPNQWDVLRNGAGDAIGVQRAAALYAHGNITLAEFDQIIARSRINPIFNYAAHLGNVKWLPVFTIGTMLTADPSLAPQAKVWLLQDGYPADQVDAYITAKSAGKTAKPKSETVSMVEAAYETGIIDEAGALAELKTLGYKDAEAALILRNVEAKRELTIRTSAISKVRSAFLARHIDVAKVRAEFAALNIAAAVIPEYVRAWQIELDTQHKQLTAGQIGSLVRRGRIGKARAVKKWEELGYSADDADLMYLDYEPTAASLKSGAPAANAPA